MTEQEELARIAQTLDKLDAPLMLSEITPMRDGPTFLRVNLKRRTVTGPWRAVSRSKKSGCVARVQCLDGSGLQCDLEDELVFWLYEHAQRVLASFLMREAQAVLKKAEAAMRAARTIVAQCNDAAALLQESEDHELHVENFEISNGKIIARLDA